jgi:RNA polymerase sigma factor (sigma-70 family)
MPHVELADAAVEIGPPPAARSYLNVEALLDAAQKTGAEGVHPGYGFLAERADFARACEDAGLTFVGPSSEHIALMGDKARAREAARAQEHLTVRLRRPATEREVADALHIAPRELRESAPPQLLSIELLCEGADGGSVDPFADQGPDPAATALDREVRRQLWRAVAQLGERDRLVIRLYYLENRTLAEIGRMLGVTESRICQLHSRLVGRLRGCLDEVVAS